MVSLLGQQTPGADELYDIVVLEPTPSIWPVVLWSTLGVLLLAAAAVALWYFLKDKNGDDRKSAGATVLNRLRNIERRQGELEPNQVGLAISDALKDYLSEKFDDPIRYQTSQEFLKRISSTKSTLPAPAQQKLLQFLAESEEVKFGNTLGAENKLLPLFKRANEIVLVCEDVNESKPSDKEW